MSILKAVSGGINLSPEVDLNIIGASPRAEGYSGADCAALLREAGLAVLKEDISTSSMDVDPTHLCITPRHFDYAFDHVVPSVSRKDQARYNRMRDRMAHARSRGAVIAETATEDGDETKDVVKGEIDTVLESSTEMPKNEDQENNAANRKDGSEEVPATNGGASEGTL